MKITLDDFINWFVNNPRRVFGIDERKVESGYIADLTVLDINNFKTYKENEILSLSKNSPYIGMRLKGFPIMTMVKGNIVWEEK